MAEFDRAPRAADSPRRAAPAPTKPREHPLAAVRRRLGNREMGAFLQHRSEQRAGPEADSPPADLRTMAEKRSDLNAGIAEALAGAADPAVGIADLAPLAESIRARHSMQFLKFGAIRTDPATGRSSVTVSAKVNPWDEVAGEMVTQEELNKRNRARALESAAAAPSAAASAASVPTRFDEWTPSQEEQWGAMADLASSKASANSASSVAASAASVPTRFDEWTPSQEEQAGAMADIASSAAASSPSRNLELVALDPGFREMSPEMVRALTPAYIKTRQSSGGAQGSVASPYRGNAPATDARDAVANLSFNEAGIQYRYTNAGGGAHAEENLLHDLEPAMERFTTRTDEQVTSIHVHVNFMPCDSPKKAPARGSCIALLKDEFLRLRDRGIAFTVSYGDFRRYNLPIAP